MTLAQWWFFFVSTSDQKFYNEVGVQLYNIFFTGLPVVLLGIQDQVHGTQRLYRDCPLPFV